MFCPVPDLADANVNLSFTAWKGGVPSVLLLFPYRQQVVLYLFMTKMSSFIHFRGNFKSYGELKLCRFTSGFSIMFIKNIEMTFVFG